MFTRVYFSAISSQPALDLEAEAVWSNPSSPSAHCVKDSICSIHKMNKLVSCAIPTSWSGYEDHVRLC